jgi:hypothetical protein
VFWVILVYFNIKHKEHPPEVWHIPPGTPCIYNIFPTHCVYAFRPILKTNNDYFRTQLLPTNLVKRSVLWFSVLLRAMSVTGRGVDTFVKRRGSQVF